MATKTKSKSCDLPKKYTPGFIADLDRRSIVYKQLRASYNEVVAEAGGKDSLTHTKRALIERFVFLEACLQSWEHEIATNPKVPDSLLSRWVQASNSLIGLAKVIGLNRTPRKAANLKQYMKERGE